MSDEGIAPSDTCNTNTPQDIKWQIIRVHARQLNHKVKSFLIVHTFLVEAGMLLTSVLLLRNMGEAPQHHMDVTPRRSSLIRLQVVLKLDCKFGSDYTDNTSIKQA